MAIQQMHTYCAMCKSRCGVLATVEDGRLTKVTADPEHPNGCICVKGTAAPEIVYSPDRLQYPMVRTRPKGEHDPGWARISWDEAMALTASRLEDIKARYGPEAVVFGCASAAGTSAADFFPWVQRLANAFGSPNLLYANHLCGWHKSGSAQYTYGVSMPQPDYEHTRCMLLWGYNPQASQPTDAMRISRAKARGAKLIVIDPHKASVVDKADLWLQVRPGSDGALALAMIHVLLEEALYDAAFVRTWTNGPFLVREDTQQLLTERDLTPTGPRRPLSPGTAGGLPPWPITLTAGMPRTTWTSPSRAPIPAPSPTGQRCMPTRPGAAPGVSRPVCPGAVGGADLGTSGGRAPGRPNVHRRAALVLRHGGGARRARQCHADQPGRVSVLCPHWPVRSARQQRALRQHRHQSPRGTGLLPKEQASRTLGSAERPLGPPGTAGQVTAYDMYRAILTEQPYPVKGLITFGTDLLMGNGDPLRGKAALEALDFYVHVDLCANPSASLADLLLPAATCWERAALRPSLGTGAEMATWAQLREPVVQPLHESRSEVAIIFDLATRLGLGEHFFDGDIEAAYAYELAPSGLTVQQLRQHPMGMRARGETRYQKYAELDAATGQPRGFPTPTRKVEIYSTHFARAGYAPLPVYQEPGGSLDMAQEYPLLLSFFRLVQYCDVQHRNIPRLRRQVPEPFLEIHPATAAAASIQDGEWVILETATGRIRLKAKCKASLHPGVVATAHGWWQGCRELGLPGYDPFGPEGANANLLVSNDVIDPISGSVPHRSQRCRVRKEGVLA